MKQFYSRPSFMMCIFLLLFVSCNKTPDYGPDIFKPDTGFKVVGYLGGGNFDVINDLELDKLTHLNLAFANPDADGNLLFDGNHDIKPVVAKGHEAGLKVYISLAGGGRPDTVIWKSLLTKRKKSDFIGKIVDYVETNNLDGVDVDIEGNLFPYVRESYNPFVIELKEALHAKGKGITTALGAYNVNKVVSQEALEAYDFINVMVYDKTGTWRPDDIGPHSPYSYAEEAIKYWTVDRKIPAERIILGVPFYGFDFTPPARYIDYHEIISKDVSLAYQDSKGMRYYNGIPMIVKKTELAKKDLGGIMIWELSCDRLDDLSLLRAIDQTLKAAGPVKTYYRDEDGDGFGNPAKPFHASEQPEGYVLNKDDPDDSNKRIRPKK
jgi:chitinase